MQPIPCQRRLYGKVPNPRSSQAGSPCAQCSESRKPSPADNILYSQVRFMLKLGNRVDSLGSYRSSPRGRFASAAEGSREPRWESRSFALPASTAYLIDTLPQGKPAGSVLGPRSSASGGAYAEPAAC